MLPNEKATQPDIYTRYTADIAENIRKSVAYGFGDAETAGKMVKRFDWTTLKHKRDNFIQRLNGI